MSSVDNQSIGMHTYREKIESREFVTLSESSTERINKIIDNLFQYHSFQNLVANVFTTYEAKKIVIEGNIKDACDDLKNSESCVNITRSYPLIIYDSSLSDAKVKECIIVELGNALFFKEHREAIDKVWDPTISEQEIALEIEHVEYQAIKAVWPVLNHIAPGSNPYPKYWLNDESAYLRAQQRSGHTSHIENSFRNYRRRLKGDHTSENGTPLVKAILFGCAFFLGYQMIKESIRVR